MRQIPEPLTIFLIGATGDLAKKKIWKALYRLFEQDLLPPQCRVIGVARTKYSLEGFHSFIAHSVFQDSTPARWKPFSSLIEYCSGDVASFETFEKLKTVHSQNSSCGNHLWYVATLPNLYLSVIRNIKAAKLQRAACGWTKLLLEKPFGIDLESSQLLNDELLQVFDEEQIYRIDHFLAKETVQNLLVFRFGNGLFEHLWNRQFVDHIQITASEKIGIGGRGVFFDSVGTVRDVVQNHVLQMLAMTLMEEPSSLEPSELRHRRMQFLSQLATFQEDLSEKIIFGQYQQGAIDGEAAVGYLQEIGIPSHSRTETAVAGKIIVENERWQGVPIYFRAGKRLKETVTEISVKFKEPLNKMFTSMESPQGGNVLTLRIQPNEGVIVRLNVKKPGLELTMEEASMQFCYSHQFQMGLVEAYEKLLYDAVLGDPSLFPQAKDIEASWRFVQPILNLLADPETHPLPYVAGSWGPAAFEKLLTDDGRTWLAPNPDVCAAF